MTKLFLLIGVLAAIACNSSSQPSINSDSTIKTAGSSDGANTIGADTARMDTSLSTIKKDSVR